MARFIGGNEDDARALLAAAGVTLASVQDGDAPEELVAELQPAEARLARDEVEMAVPEEPSAGMGAWHVNAVDEVHVVLSGQGLMEFVTIEGPVSVAVETGDVVVIRGAEHRYRPLTPQRWRLRFGGPRDADLVTTYTGRASGPWPIP